MLWGGSLDVVNALACIGTAVDLFPVVKRQNEAVALGFVTSRVLEAAVIVTGVVSPLSVVTLRQNLAGVSGADTASLVTTGQALVAVRDWTFLLVPGLMAGVNALLLGSLMYQSRLVPRVIPLMGLIGAPLLLASTTATFFGLYEQVSVWSAIATIPVAAWELSLGIWLVVKGFRPSPLTSAITPAVGVAPSAARRVRRQPGARLRRARVPARERRSEPCHGGEVRRPPGRRSRPRPARPVPVRRSALG